MDRSTLVAQVPHALATTDLPGLAAPYRGKVRDVYPLSGDRLLFVTTDRISAFDVVLGTVPFKGELLTSLAAAWFERTADACPNHVLDRPDPNALVVRKLRALPVEVVVRGRLTGSLLRDHAAGRDPYGLALPPGLTDGHVFETPVLTPTTKAAVGDHDQPLSEADVVARGLVDARTWSEVRRRAIDLFAAGTAFAASRGLVLVDTKYEFGTDADGSLRVMDEIHTPDSSRYWRHARGRHARAARQGIPAKMAHFARLVGPRHAARDPRRHARRPRRTLRGAARDARRRRPLARRR